jgi:hypothetical protein
MTKTSMADGPNGEVAPIPAIRGTEIERHGSTLCGPSLRGRQRQRRFD